MQLCSHFDFCNGSKKAGFEDFCIFLKIVNHGEHGEPDSEATKALHFQS